MVAAQLANDLAADAIGPARHDGYSWCIDEHSRRRCERPIAVALSLSVGHVRHWREVCAQEALFFWYDPTRSCPLYSPPFLWYLHRSGGRARSCVAAGTACSDAELAAAR